jgi:SAM-dependent methyltransferase
MDKNTLDKEFWNTRWQNHETGWDIGYASPAIIDYMTSYPDKQASILIPGCGNAYEAQALLDLGFSNLTLVDIAPTLVKDLAKKHENDARIRVLCQDFFELTEQFDLVIEQTFFCALQPNLRPNYVQKMKQILKPTGKLIGLMFDKCFEQTGPPFGGSANEYKALFETEFTIEHMKLTDKSIEPRKGSELFVEFTNNKIA